MPGIERLRSRGEGPRGGELARVRLGIAAPQPPHRWAPKGETPGRGQWPRRCGASPQKNRFAPKLSRKKSISSGKKGLVGEHLELRGDGAPQISFRGGQAAAERSIFDGVGGYGECGRPLLLPEMPQPAYLRATKERTGGYRRMASWLVGPRSENWFFGALPACATARFAKVPPDSDASFQLGVRVNRRGRSGANAPRR